jgi:hypothetical protein
MTRLLSASLTLILCSAAVAQQPSVQGIQIFPASGRASATNGTSVATRLQFGNAAGEAIAQYPKTHFDGIGDVSLAGGSNNPQCALSHIVLYIQDQDRTTADKFGVAMRPAATAGGPNISNTAAIFYFPNSVTLPTATGSGAISWEVSLQFQSNSVPTPRPIPCGGDLFLGAIFNANSKWPATDGLSTWAAFYDPVANKVTSGDAVAPRTGVPNLTWQIAGSTPTVTQPTIAQVLDYILVSPYAMIQVGARHKAGQSNHGSNDGFGAAGLYPSIAGGANGRQDGLIVRITDNPPGTTPTYGGIYLLYLSISRGSQLSIPPIQLNGLYGSVYLGPIGQFPLGGGVLSTTGPQTTVLVAPPGFIPATVATAKAAVYFQAAVTRRASPALAITNLAGVQY